MSATTRQLAHLGNEIFGDRSDNARRDDEMAREREELSFDAVHDLHHDVGFPPCPASFAVAVPVPAGRVPNRCVFRVASQEDSATGASARSRR